VLGCTHYPYLIPQIKKIIGNEIQIIDSGEAVARQTKAILEKNNLLLNSNPKKSNTFFSNSNIKILKRILKNYKEVDISKIEF
jgi:glutamate racemase